MFHQKGGPYGQKVTQSGKNGQTKFQKEKSEILVQKEQENGW